MAPKHQSDSSGVFFQRETDYRGESCFWYLKTVNDKIEPGAFEVIGRRYRHGKKKDTEDFFFPFLHIQHKGKEGHRDHTVTQYRGLSHTGN